MKFRDLFDEKLYPKWEEIQYIPEFECLKETPQSSVWHKEGDVWEHTVRVTNKMYDELIGDDTLDLFDEDFASNVDFLYMMTAALCHDLGKATTTKWDEEKQDYVTSHHNRASERIVRTLFYDEDIVLRERVCCLVKNHMLFHHIVDDPEKLNRKLVLFSNSNSMVTVNDLLLLGYCDSKGSVNEIETDDYLMNNIAVIQKAAYDLCCTDQPYKFAYSDALIDFYRSEQPEPIRYDEKFEKPYGSELTILVGVPGSGKDTWVNTNVNRETTTVLCRDEIRTEIGIQGEKPFGTKEQEEEVTKIFNDRLLDCLKSKRNVVINNTNISTKYRNGFIDKATEYDALIRIVYIEPVSIDECKSRRQSQMPTEVIDRMWNNLEFPNGYEANEIWIYPNNGEPIEVKRQCNWFPEDKDFKYRSINN